MDNIWIQGDLDLREEFEQGNYSKLLEYVEQNELHLIQLLSSRDFETLRKSLRFSTGTLRFLEYSLKQDPKSSAAFKLGELFGYIECLNHLSYEDDSNILALKAFYVARTHMLFLEENQVKELLSVISSESNMTKSLLYSKNPSLKEVEIDYALKVFDRFAIINCYDQFPDPLYGLTDLGRRIVKQFKLLEKAP